jgi:molybdopterin-binding protein
VSTYRIAEAASLLGVSDDTLRRWAEAGRVELRTEAGRTVVAGADLARLAESLADHPDRERTRASAVSARNRLAGIVTKVTKDTVMAQVEMICGPYRLVSLMSSEAAEELGLEPGVRAIASVKSTNVVVERP